MKIEEIERLNEERTQGDWVLNKQLDYWDVQPDIVRCGYEGETTVGIEDAAFIVAAPTITDQYIKARRFVVTKEFVASAMGGLHTGLPMSKAIEVAQAVLGQLWEEVEGE